MSSTWTVGQTILSTGYFKSESGAAFDPIAVAFNLRIVEGTFPAPAQPPVPAIMRTKPDGSGAATGYYYALIPLTLLGEWHLQWYSTDPTELATSNADVVFVVSNGF